MVYRSVSYTGEEHRGARRNSPTFCKSLTNVYQTWLYTPIKHWSDYFLCTVMNLLIQISPKKRVIKMLIPLNFSFMNIDEILGTQMYIICTFSDTFILCNDLHACLGKPRSWWCAPSTDLKVIWSTRTTDKMISCYWAECGHLRITDFNLSLLPQSKYNRVYGSNTTRWYNKTIQTSLFVIYWQSPNLGPISCSLS